METHKFINGLLFFTIMAGLFLSSCQKMREYEDLYESQLNHLGFCVGDSIQYFAHNIPQLTIFGSLIDYSDGAGCFMSHCASKQPVSLKSTSKDIVNTISQIDAVLDKYSKEKAMSDSLWAWAYIRLNDSGRFVKTYQEYDSTRNIYINKPYYSFPAFPLVGLAFKVSVKDILYPETVSVPSDCVLLEEGYKLSSLLLPEKYRPQTETENRITVNYFLVDFTTTDLDSLRFEGKFSMDWTIDCGEEQVRLSTNSGFFNYDMKRTLSGYRLNAY